MRVKAFLAVFAFLALVVGMLSKWFSATVEQVVTAWVLMLWVLSFRPGYCLGAAQVYGTAHLYGPTGTISNATVTDESFDSVCAQMNAVEDEAGVAIERRYNDITTEGVITIIIRSGYTIPDPADVLTYNSIKYEITKVGRRASNKTHRVVELAVKNSEGITLP